MSSYLEYSNRELRHGDGEAEERDDVEDVKGTGGEVEEVEGRVEELVAGAHGEQDGAGGVVEVHDGVPAGVHELVARSALKNREVCDLCKVADFNLPYLHKGGVQVDPVAADVDDHAQLEEERPRRVERAERRQ